MSGSRTIKAEAIISAKDATGNVFDAIAKKFKGVEKNAKALADIKPPKLSGEFFEKELGRLKLTRRELRGVQKEFAALDKTIRGVGPVHPSSYMRQVDEWRGKTLNHWRDVKTATEEAEKVQKRYHEREKFLHRAGHYTTHSIAHVAGIAGGSYAAAHAFRETMIRAGERQRENIRYEQMGLSSDQLAEGSDIADKISRQFPSLSRTEVLDYLRTNASRLGSWERSKEVEEPYARALIANKLSGGDDHEMEQTVRALEGMGDANTAAQITEGLNAFARAKAANPDYTGEQFRADMAAASSSKYGLSKDYLENIFPILASHTSGFGNKLSTGLSALVGNRMTKQSRASLTKAGLIENGHLVDEDDYISNNFEWTQRHVRPLLEKRGVKFGEDMSEADKGKVVEFLAKSFSARNAADLMATNLLDAPLVEKARQRKVVGLEQMDDLQRRDAFLAWDGVTSQLKDFGAALMSTKAALTGMNDVSGEIAKRVNYLNKGEYVKALLPEDDQRIIKWFFPGDREKLQNTIDDANSWLGRHDDQGGASRAWRLKRFDAEQQLHVGDLNDTMPPIFTDAEVKRMRDAYVPLPMEDPRQAADRFPAPAEHFEGPAAMPPVQPLDAAPQRVDVQGTVEGQATIQLQLQPSKWWDALEQKVDNLVKLVGNLGSNGPGSTGRSSPDAAAPARTLTGASGSW